MENILSKASQIKRINENQLKIESEMSRIEDIVKAK